MFIQVVAIGLPDDAGWSLRRLPESDWCLFRSELEVSLMMRVGAEEDSPMLPLD